MELVCPAGSERALKVAVDNGADAVYLGFKDETNARHFAGLNFSDRKLEHALDYARQRGVKVYLAVNTFPQPSNWHRWQSAIDTAASLNVNAVIAADISVMDYAAEHHPNLALHLSVQGSATNVEALKFYHTHFDIRRAVLPRVLSLAQVQKLSQQSPVALEVFGFGSLCIMAEGRCYLSSYVTGESPNSCGVCSPASAVSWQEKGKTLESRLNGVLIDRYEEGESAGYPTLCKGRFQVENRIQHVLEEPTSLNTLKLLPELHAMGIQAVKLEGRQRSPAYVEQVVRVWREALDAYQQAPENFLTRPEWMRTLAKLSEGRQTTLGAYSRPWQ